MLPVVKAFFTLVQWFKCLDRGARFVPSHTVRSTSPRLTLVRKLKVWATGYFTLTDMSSRRTPPSWHYGMSMSVHRTRHTHTSSQAPSSCQKTWRRTKRERMTAEDRSEVLTSRLAVKIQHPRTQLQSVYPHRKQPLPLKPLLLPSTVTFSLKPPSLQRGRCVVSQRLVERLCVIVQCLESRDIEPLSFLTVTKALKWNSLRPATLAGLPV